MQFHKNKIRISFVLMLLLILPIFLGAIYMVQKSSSQANASCPALNIKVQRTSNSTARIAFDTSCSVKAKVNCAIARGGIKFFCAEDSLATQNHILTTEEVTLSTNTGYYIFIDTGTSTPVLGHIPASPVDSTYGLSFNAFDEKTMGTSSEDENYDPALDINQDGVINIIDKMEFY
ncbi:hypothetical protein A3I56_00180 [Candidatus Roizmanbacteria bacterium RIFCSPLOWO2_02_FULL_43_10]|uniref:Dockerin domain-containing protein n=2 Tax=Candidatus Roizmaniibacteriota TaxID=1752723 RepID=A0A1F7JUA6_9BACT|nr:MAG: hypothetical protein A3F32_01270 [Candidatus Roizmanbacteria bacterium RIFCSPHIGHO2_12_FULL_42_10]OGK59195.1 MAG: hypothetical protein A3I56_00180 [Candidatus Roizmanbacteria bacterium RIFCSPLOWO2_02_FULL_43_10]